MLSLFSFCLLFCFLIFDIGDCSTPGFGGLKGKHGGMHPKNESNTTRNHHKLIVWFDNECATNKKETKV